MRKGKPIVVNGDGTSLWTITHNTDFARGIVGLFGNPATIGEAFHITSDEVLDWDRIYTYIAHAAGVEANLLHIASDDGLQGLLVVSADAQMQCQPVTTTAWNDAQHLVRADNPSCHFIYGAVTSDRHDHTLGSLARKHFCMACIFSAYDFQPLLFQMGYDTGLAPFTRYGIDNEKHYSKIVMFES
jgi:hypothetical protein